MKILRCSKCGRDISKAFKFYIKNEPYCYDCSEAYKESMKETKEEQKRRRMDPLTRAVRQDYNTYRMKVSEIAEKYGITKLEVYERLIDD